MFVALVVCVAFIAFLLVERLRSNGRDKFEPPALRPTIPYIGHIVGMIGQRARYFARLRDQCQFPIVTLRLFGTRVYVAFSLPTIQSIQKQSKALAFQPIQIKFSVKLCGASKEAHEILLNDSDPENGQYGNIFLSMHHALSPGETLNEMTQVMMGRICKSLDTLRPGDSVKLDEWLRHHVTLATTEAVYGPHNPFRNNEIKEAFWEFEREIPKLIFFPSWFTRHGARNRQIVADAFQNFFSNNYHEQASGLVKDFYASECSYGFSLPDRSLFEVGHAVATLANTYAAVFWMVFYIFSSPEVLRDIRKEVSTIITVVSNEKSGIENRPDYFLDMTKVNSHCPILVSTFRETSRLYSMGIFLRQVCKDTTVGDGYQLKKDGIVLMPTIAVHTDTRIWGPDALSFNHRRFLETKVKNGSGVSPAAWRSFGGGTTLCPGRHFATMQILAWASILAMRFDMKPTSDSEDWTPPTTYKSNLANVMMRPDQDVEVKLSAREGYQEGNWNVKVSGKEFMVDVTVEDMEDTQERATAL